jgi:TolB-like protein/DNA-binding winged helix-turn-helix (wHTH) protein/Flp pilus assembly protein TadD
MRASSPPSSAYRFGDFTLDLQAGELRKQGVKLKIQGQPLEILAMLLERRGQMVAREEFQKKLWPSDTFVDFEHGLNAAVRRLREALNDSAETPRYVETLARRGYRFIAAAEGCEQPQEAQIARRHSKYVLAGLLGLGLAVALLAGLALRAMRERSRVAASRSRIQSVAVLPLTNLSSDPEQEYFADGMTDALITDLAKIRTLRVISRTSAMHYKDTKKTLPEVARELGVDAIVEGTVTRTGNRFRITAQLIRAEGEGHIWAESYESQLSDILTVQREIALAVATHVRSELSGKEPVAARAVAPAVYESYLKGRFGLHKNTRAGLEEALRHFQVALDADATFAPAYAGLAAAYSDLGMVFFGAPPLEARAKVFAAARKALELDPSLVEARVLLADALQKDWQWAKAEAEYKQAIELSPSDAGAYDGFAQWLLCQGRTQEALVWERRAQELDPLALHGIDIGGILNNARRYDEAIRELRSVLAVEPEDPFALWFLGFALIGAERFDEAIATLERAASLSDRSSAVLGVLVGAYAGAGRRTEALRVLGELHRRRQTGYVPAAAFLNAYLGLGDTEEAFTWLGRAAEERSNIMQFLKVHPCFDPLRGDPRFAAFLRRANFQ